MAIPLETIRERYLSLVEAAVSGLISEDDPLPVFGSGKFDRKVREDGLDWPSNAFTMIGAKRLRNFRALIENVIEENVEGDIIETGVWRGGACIMARAVLKAHEIKERRVILADSFQGLPPPNEEAFPADTNSDFHTYQELSVSLEQVKSNFERFDLLDEQVVFLPGWFKDTMPTAPIEKLAIIRLDGDMYESTIDPLNHLWDKLSVGGWIIVDDFEVVPACKAAVYDFLATRGVNPQIHPIDGVGVYFKKENDAGAVEWLDLNATKWLDHNTFRTKNFLFNTSTENYDGKTTELSVSILKNRPLIDFYTDYFNSSSPEKVLELGFFQGGMPLFISDVTESEKIVAIDRLSATEELIGLIKKKNLSNRIKLYGNVFQNDTYNISKIISAEFNNYPLDIIIDDCSHEYEDTKKCFEHIFGFLRIGGKYFIENWGWLHWPGYPWQTRESPFCGQTAMTTFITELMMVLASKSGVVSKVEVVNKSLVIVTRGPGLAHGEKLDIDGSYLTSGRPFNLFPGGSPGDWV